MAIEETKKPICLAKGASKTIRFTVTDKATGALIDLTGATIEFAVNDDEDSDTPLITKASTTITEIEILTQSGATLGQGLIYLLPSDTSALEPDTYFYDIWVTTALLQEYQVVKVNDFIVEARIVA